MTAKNKSKKPLSPAKLAQYQFCVAYTKRFQDILIRLPSKALDPSDEAWKGVPPDAVAGPIRAYIDLCAEQEFMQRVGALPDEVWDLWTPGIVNMFKLPAVKATWQSMQELGGYDSLAAFLKQPREHT